MVTTRQSQPLAAEQPETPKQLEWLSHPDAKVNDALTKLGDIADITFPLPSEKESPAKRNKSPTHEIKTLFSWLFFNDRNTLTRQVRTFLEWRPVWHNQQDEKLRFLQDVLSKAHGSVQSSRANRISPGKHASSPPRSPTMSVKHISSIQTEAIDEIQLPRATRITSNTTSNNTSFANTSFWSEAQKPSQDPPSPATTIEDSCHTTQDYGSSWNESAVSKFPEKLAAAGYAVKNEMQLDGASDIVQSQKTVWGSSPRYSQVDLDALLQGSNIGMNESSASAGNKYSEALIDQTSDTTALQSSESTVEKTPKPRAEGVSRATTKKPLESPADSPSKVVPENVRVRNIVRQGLTDLHLPPSILGMDLKHRSAFYIVAQDCNICPEDLEQQWTEPRALPSLQKIARNHVPSFRPFGNFSYAECSLRARASFSDALDGRLIVMRHTRPQKQLPTLLEKIFGYGRFLTLDVDPLKPSERLGLSEQTTHIRQRLQEMLMNSQEFLGYTWQQFYAQEKKGRKLGEEPVQSGAMQFPSSLRKAETCHQ